MGTPFLIGEIKKRWKLCLWIFAGAFLFWMLTQAVSCKAGWKGEDVWKWKDAGLKMRHLKDDKAMRAVIAKANAEIAEQRKQIASLSSGVVASEKKRVKLDSDLSRLEDKYSKAQDIQARLRNLEQQNQILRQNLSLANFSLDQLGPPFPTFGSGGYHFSFPPESVTGKLWATIESQSLIIQAQESAYQSATERILSLEDGVSNCQAALRKARLFSNLKTWVGAGLAVAVVVSLVKK